MCPAPTPNSRMEVLHQGLYLGFKGLRAIPDPAIQRLWHDATLNITRYDIDPAGTNATDSLFNLGGMLLVALREIAFVGTSGGTAPLADNPRFRFLMANGPTVANSAYLRSLNLKVWANRARKDWLAAGVERLALGGAAGEVRSVPPLVRARSWHGSTSQIRSRGVLAADCLPCCHCRRHPRTAPCRR
jgi:hypothetical protein